MTMHRTKTKGTATTTASMSKIGNGLLGKGSPRFQNEKKEYNPMLNNMNNSNKRTMNRYGSQNSLTQNTQVGKRPSGIITTKNGYNGIQKKQYDQLHNNSMISEGKVLLNERTPSPDKLKSNPSRPSNPNHNYNPDAYRN